MSQDQNFQLADLENQVANLAQDADASRDTLTKPVDSQNSRRSGDKESPNIPTGQAPRARMPATPRMANPAPPSDGAGDLKSEAAFGSGCGCLCIIIVMGLLLTPVAIFGCRYCWVSREGYMYSPCTQGHIMAKPPTWTWKENAKCALWLTVGLPCPDCVAEFDRQEAAANQSDEKQQQALEPTAAGPTGINANDDVTQRSPQQLLQERELEEAEAAGSANQPNQSKKPVRIVRETANDGLGSSFAQRGKLAATPPANVSNATSAGSPDLDDQLITPFHDPRAAVQPKIVLKEKKVYVSQEEAVISLQSKRDQGLEMLRAFESGIEQKRLQNMGPSAPQVVTKIKVVEHLMYVSKAEAITALKKERAEIREKLQAARAAAMAARFG